MVKKSSEDDGIFISLARLCLLFTIVLVLWRLLHDPSFNNAIMGITFIVIGSGYYFYCKRLWRSDDLHSIRNQTRRDKEEVWQKR